MAGFSDGNATAPSKLSRQIYRAVLAILRPAESATRRLIVAASRGLVVELPARRQRKAKPAPEPTPQAKQAEHFAGLRRLGIAIVGDPVDLVPAASNKPRKRSLSLPLFDPPHRVFRKRRPPTTPDRIAPRISIPGITPRFQPEILHPPARKSPTADTIDATRLRERLSALAAALDDLPGQARRFVRLKASRLAGSVQDNEAASNRPVRFKRLSPLRVGRAPGGRLMHLGPAAMKRRKPREIDEILATAHALAIEALATAPPRRPDTS